MSFATIEIWTGFEDTSGITRAWVINRKDTINGVSTDLIEGKKTGADPGFSE
jgi:hypothetical protein